MAFFYFKRPWDETTGSPLTNSWGTSIYYFETDDTGEVHRQLEVYNKGQRLRYDQKHIEDQYGGLSEILLDLKEFENYKIAKEEFEEAWTINRMNIL